MIPIETCRKLVPNSDKFADEEIVEIRETLYGLAELALESYNKNKERVELLKKGV